MVESRMRKLRAYLGAWILFSIVLSAPTLESHAYLAAAIEIDSWELEQSPSEIISKFRLAIKLENVERVRGKRRGDLIIMRLESQSLCTNGLCPTIVVRDCETAPCPQATILAGPTFTPLSPQTAIFPETYILAFEGLGKKGIFLIVGPAFILATTLF
jgi:hypothetical protein